jgi:hypothetical protein
MMIEASSRKGYSLLQENTSNSQGSSDMKFCKRRTAVVCITLFITTLLLTYVVGLPNHMSVFNPASVPPVSIFSGNYNDPNHPGMKREITNIGNVVTIQGSDNADGSNPFKFDAIEDPLGTIVADFSSKGGPKGLKGVFNIDINSIEVKTS